jgi:putative ABC transport system ATP-binding protein
MTPSAEPVFFIRELQKRRRGAGASFELQVPALTIQAGEIVVLKGVSGSGKSTLLDMLALALRPDQVSHFRFAPGNGISADAGRLWRNNNVDALGRLRGEHIGYVLQTGGLLSFLTVRENMALSCHLLGRPADPPLEDLAEQLGISAQLDKLPGQLSVGERQRVAIARALAHRPSVVLADEPTASVDPLNADVILQLFLGLVERFGVTTIIASHDWQRIAAAGLQLLQHRLEKDGAVTRALFWN